MSRAWAVLALALTLAIAGCGDADPGSSASGDLEVHGAWVDPSPTGKGPAGGFLTLMNRSDRAWVLVGASSPDAGRVELHRSWIEGGIARMAPVATARVEPGEHFAFEPGGYHLMIFDAPTLAGASGLSLRLEFENGEVREVEATIGPAGGHAAGQGDHSAH